MINPADLIQRISQQYILTQRLGHALKTGLAIIAGALLCRLMGIQNSQWVLITIIVVMSSQINVGSLVQKATMRFAGTCAGALVSLFAIIFLGTHSNDLLMVAVLSAIGFTWLAGSPGSLSYVGTLGATTVMIILMGGNVSMSLATNRVIEITLGVIISVLVSMFIFPIRASRILEENISDIFKLLGKLYQTACTLESAVGVASPFYDMEIKIRKAIALHERLRKEAQHEPGNTRFTSDSAPKLEHAMRRIFRGILQMHHVYLMLDNADTRFFGTPDIQLFHATVFRALSTISDGLSGKSPGLESTEALHHEIPMSEKNCTDEEQKILHAFLIATRQVTQNIYACQVILNKKSISD